MWCLSRKRYRGTLAGEIRLRSSDRRQVRRAHLRTVAREVSSLFATGWNKARQSKQGHDGHASARDRCKVHVELQKSEDGARDSCAPLTRTSPRGVLAQVPHFFLPALSRRAHLPFRWAPMRFLLMFPLDG